LSPLTINNT